MLLNYIRSNKVSFLLLLPIIAALLYWLPSNTGNSGYYFPSTIMPLYSLILLFGMLSGFVAYLLGFLSVLILAFLITRLNIKYMIIEARTYLPALFIIIISLFYVPLHIVHPGVIAAIFVLLVVDKVFNTYSDESKIIDFFSASLFLSIGSLFYFNIVFLVVFIWYSISSQSKNRWKAWLITIIGIFIPYFFIWTISYLANTSEDFLERINSNFDLILVPPSVIIEHLFVINIAYYFMFSFLIILVFISSIKIIRSLRGNKINVRKYFVSFFILFFILILQLVFFSTVAFEILPIIAIPLSFLFSYYLFHMKNKLFGNIIIVTLFVLLILIQVYPLLIIN